MKDFRDKVAVVTGAASGIGRGMADRFATEGMKVVLADIDKKALRQTEEEMRAKGASVLAVPTDVASFESIEVLAQTALKAFGAIHLLCNNAGIGVACDAKAVWEIPLADCHHIMDINLWSVIYGCRVFVPLMLKQNTEGHIVNTASIAGLTTGSGIGMYRTTKHGVVSFSEVLHSQLAQRGAKIKVSVLCPGFVRTSILSSAQKRGTSDNLKPEEQELLRAIEEGVQAGIAPSQAADCVVKAILEEKFYILTHEDSKEHIRVRMENILEDRNPAG